MLNWLKRCLITNSVEDGGNTVPAELVLTTASDGGSPVSQADAAVQHKVPEWVIEQLIRQLADRNAGMAQLQEEKKKWLSKYREAVDYLQQSAMDDPEVGLAARLLKDGKIEEAGAELERLISTTQPNQAIYHLARGLLFDLQFHWLRALVHYEETHQHALALHGQRRYQEAARICCDLLPRYRGLAQDSPPTQLPAIATTLNSLASLFQDAGQLAEAECACQEALTIRRGLAKENPATYLPVVAKTLNDLLAILYGQAERTAEAERIYEEALSIRRELSEEKPATMALDHLAILCANAGGHGNSNSA